MSKVLGVGIIGASAQRGWAKDSHVPAVQGVEGLRLVAVAAGDKQKAEAAAQAFGAECGYSSGFDLIRDPAVDIVTVAVKVPDHRELVLAALAAGKHVYCEWPLGRNIAETEEMAGAAKSTGVHTSIGLQLRGSAAVHGAQQAIKDGRIGRPLTARIVSSTAAFGPVVEAAMAFGEDAENGVTLVTIQGAHTFDLAVAVLGGFASLAALTSTQYPDVTVGDEPGLKPRSTSDHVFLEGMLQSGVAIGIEVSGGRPPQAPTHFEVIGTDGTLTLRGGAMRGVQSGRLHLFLDDKQQELNEGKLAGMPDAAVNVGGVYTMLRDDILAGTHSAPGFDHAVQLNRMVDAISASSQQGIRQIEKGWPTA